MCFSQAFSSKPQKQIQVDISRKEMYWKIISSSYNIQENWRTRLRNSLRWSLRLWCKTAATQPVPVQTIAKTSIPAVWRWRLTVGTMVVLLQHLTQKLNHVFTNSTIRRKFVVASCLLLASESSSGVDLFDWWNQGHVPATYLKGGWKRKYLTISYFILPSRLIM